MNSKKQRIGIKPLLAIAAGGALALSGAQAADRSWSGATASYTNAANWTGSVVPGTNDTAINNNGTNNVVQILAGNPDWAVRELLAGSTGDGAFSQNGQTLTLSTPVRAFHLGAAAGATGVYTLSGGNLNYGSGQFNIGELGTGIFNMSGGAINGTGNFAVNRGTSLSAISATMDGGTAKSGYTWFEQGFYTLNPSLGLPAAGSTFASISNANYSFTMPASYTNNNAFMIYSNGPSATVTLSPATAVSALSFLGSAGNGPISISYVIHHADATTETGTFSVPDWFPPGANAPATAIVAGARSLGDGTGVQVITDNPRLLAADVTVTNTSSPVTTIDLSFSSGSADAHSGIMALSGSTGGAFSPITITGFNQDIVIEAGAQIQVSPSVTDVMTQTGGTLNISGETYIGQLGTGIYNLSGTGSINSSNWFVIGRNGGNGTMNMSGGTILQVSGGQPAFIVGSEDGGASIGALNQSGGTITTTAGEYWIGNGGTAKGTNTLSGTASVTVNNWLAIGRGGVGELNISGSAIITKTGNGNVVAPGSGTGIINQSGGTFTVSSGQVWLPETGDGTWNLSGGSANLGVLHLCQSAGSIGTFNLNGGTLTASEVTVGSPSALSTFNFNGGTIRPTASTAAFLHDITQVFVGPGDAIFDSQGFDITVAQNLGNNGGGLVKNGAGTLTLTGFNSYSGPTVVNAGTLSITTDASGGGDYTVGGAGTLNLKVQYLNAQLNAANVTFASPSPVLNLDLGSFGNPSAAPINASGALTVNGTATLNLTHGAPTLGQFPLIKYGTYGGAGSIVLGTVPVGVGLYLSNNVLNTSIDLVITNVNLPRWEGLAGGNWDVGLTTNWINSGTGSPTTFAQNNTVAFDDTALGTTNVNITTTVNPNGVNVNNSILPYTFNGTGKIGGAAGLTKSGTGTLVIANTGGNSYTGATVIANGVLSVSSLANGGTASAIGASSASPTNLVLSGGTLSYTGPATSINRGFSLQTTNSAIDVQNALTISGSTIASATAGLYKRGAGQLTIANAGSNTLAGSSSGGLTVAAGTLKFDGANGAQTNVVRGGLLGLGNIPGVDTAMILTNTTLVVAGKLEVGNSNTATATLTIQSNTSLTIQGNPFAVPDSGGIASTGVVVQTEGTVYSASELWVGQAAGAVGTYSLNGGTLNLSNWLALGRTASQGTFNMSGGTFNKVGNGNLLVATGNGSVGTFNMSGGTINSTSPIQIPENGNAATLGTFNMSGSSVINVSSVLTVGRGGGRGVFNMTNGTINMTASGQHLRIGTGGGSIGTFNHSGGTFNLGSGVEYWIAENSTCLGTNNISGTAVVNCPTYVTIGRQGTGVVNMSGGSFNATGAINNNTPFFLGIFSGGVGIWNHSGGTLTVNPFVHVGDGSIGTLNVSGGVVDLKGEIWIGQGNAGTGTVSVVSGNITNNSWLAVGREGGKGFLNISGGTMVKAGTGNISITHNAPATGLVNQSGGVFVCASGETWIGENGGPATWNMSGGSSTHGIVRLAVNADATGTLNLSNGVFAVSELTRGSGPGTLNFSGGTLAAVANNANFLHDLTAANISTDGAKIDSGANSVSAAQVLAGAGGLTKLGSGALYLNGANTYAGLTVVSNGTLGGSGTIAGSVIAIPGTTLAPGASVGTLTVGGDLTFGGNLAIEINKSLAQSNDLATVTGGVTNTGTGTVTVTNLGPTTISAGDKFTLFNKPVVGGGSLTIVGGGATWTNRLAIDGSIVALTGGVPTTPVTLTNSFSGGNLTLTWPADHIGWSLQVQTNTRAVGLSTNWFTVPGSSATNSVTVSTSPADPTVFYRLTYP